MGETRNRNSVRVNEEGQQKLREAKGAKHNSKGRLWTYSDIAITAGVHEKTVKRFFSRKEDVDWEYASAIAKALDLELADLIDEKPTTPPPEATTTLIEACSTMLEPQRRITSNSVTQDESAKKERKQIYVPLALVQRTKTDKRNKEDFSPDAGTRLYEPEYETQQRFEHEVFLSQILERGSGKTKGKQIAIIGEPGAGKTTLLQAIAFRVLEKDLGLPIWISLTDLVQNETLTDIKTYICNSLEDAIAPRPLTEKILNEFTNQIQQGRVWLLLDGVDEISGDAALHQPLEEISRQLTRWIGRSSRVVLTCRLNVWQADRNALETFETYRLLDFDYPQQVHEFIDNWFVEDIEKAERLKTELGSAERGRLQDLVQTPLRLMLLCRIWQTEEGNLPETKAGLYHQYVQQFYGWKQNPFRTFTKEQRELNKALGLLALRDINEGSSRFRLRESFISEELGDVDDETSLFYKAGQLGWLNHVGIAAESPSKEKVYAFYHATFEEYFAALAVEDWHYFLNHVPENPEQGTYRIFESQWKEVILLWLGREDVPKQRKEDFIKALVEFEDGCNSQSQIPDWKGFYEYRAYFLAAAGIAEFKDCSLADVIVAQIVRWSFGYFNSEKQEWHKFNIEIQHKAKAAIEETERKKTTTVLKELIRNSLDEDTCMQAVVTLGKIAKDNSIVITVLEELIGIFKSERIGIQTALNFGKIAKDNPIAIMALVDLIGNSKSANNRIEAAVFLEKIAKDNSTAITALVDLIGNYLDEDTCRLAAFTLGKIAKDNPIAIMALEALIENSQSEDTHIQAAESLGKIAKDNPIAITALVELIENSQSEDTRRQAAESLGEIAKDNLTAITALLELIVNSLNVFIPIQAAKSLGKIAKNNPIAITALVELIENSQSEYIRLLAAGTLGEIAKDNLTAIMALVELLGNSLNVITQMQVADNLKKLLTKSENLKVVVIVLKNHLSNEAYEVIWHCTQTMTYPAFYQAWHR